MNKPKKKSKGLALDYHQAIHYIENKYKIDTRNYKGKKFTGLPGDAPYCDFWHWFIEHRDIHNGCFAYLDLHDALTVHKGALAKYNAPDWVREILLLIKKEFAPRGGEIKFWVEW